ncbi:hypothetical protein SAMN04487866_12619 [Thermoactinomyces sp. DSM 45891]|uniref:hypothetical protein n=1 Tax=Thermoactinomyces sp. DSM 45891 TaxID=1761907 RepID=UPI0009197276|nr:hypothetical protein [Thermoactinomyces sp. DSM 45891]SFX79412.1 hypothetical protein SAMN04487866_12619 [Thermoactinomyces sp. DSM 45891]
MAGQMIRTKKLIEFIQDLKGQHDQLYQDYIKQGEDASRLEKILLLREVIAKMETDFNIIDLEEMMGMKFVSENHRKLFVEMKIKVLNDYNYQNTEYDTALYVLSFLQANGKVVDTYLGTQKIDFEGIRENTGMSTGEGALLDLANVCFNGYSADIHDTLGSLYGEFRQVAFEALMKKY